jgi:hypothetical protein
MRGGGTAAAAETRPLPAPGAAPPKDVRGRPAHPRTGANPRERVAARVKDAHRRDGNRKTAPTA